jgi:hypothetical protein
MRWQWAVSRQQPIRNPVITSKENISKQEDSIQFDRSTRAHRLCQCQKTANSQLRYHFASRTFVLGAAEFSGYFDADKRTGQPATKDGSNFEWAT